MGPVAGRLDIEVQIPSGQTILRGNLLVPRESRGCVVFAHGSGSSRFSPRNRYVAQTLRASGLAALLLDLLTPEEETVDLVTARLRFDVGLLAGRLLHAIEWVQSNPWLSGLPLGLFGSSTGAAAALVAAARRPRAIQAIVCRGGRPDLAADALPHVRTPTLLIVGGEDSVVLELNQLAVGRLRAPVELAIVPGATHLFEEPGALERVVELALDWFVSHLSPGANWPLVTGSGDGAGEGNAPNRPHRGRP